MRSLGWLSWRRTGLAQSLDIPVGEASKLLSSFLATFSGVRLQLWLSKVDVNPGWRSVELTY